MKNKRNNSELISNYFDGLLSKDEVRWFNRKLIEDKELAAEFRLFLEIDKAINNEDIDSLRQQLNKFTSADVVNFDEESNNLDEAALYEEIDMAIMDEDVLKLRTSLDNLNYIKVEDNKEEMEKFSSELSNELILYDEIDQAINDQEVVELREKLDSIHNEVEYEIFKPEKALNNDILNQELEDAISDNDLTDLKNKLEIIHKDIINTETKDTISEKNEKPVFKLFTREESVKTLFTPLKIASSIIVMAVGIMTIILLSSSGKDNFYNKNMIAFNASGNTRGGDVSSINNNLENATKEYADKNYSQSAFFYSKAEAQNTLNIKEKFYYANAAIMNGDFDKSEKLLTEVIADPYTELRTDAIWYLAIVYMKTEKYDDATELLSILENEENNYNWEKAIKILKKLKKE